MKTAKRLTSGLLAVLVLLSCLCFAGMTVGAEVPEMRVIADVDAEALTAAIFVDYLAGEPGVNHTYNVYQVLKIAETPIGYEMGYSVFDDARRNDLAKLLVDLDTWGSAEPGTVDIADELVSKWLVSQPGEPLADDQLYAVMTNNDFLKVEPGYYLLRDINSEAATSTFSAYMLGEARGLTTNTGLFRAEPKASLPEFKKEVQNSDGFWSSSAGVSFINPEFSDYYADSDFHKQHGLTVKEALGLTDEEFEMFEANDWLYPLHTTDIIPYRLTATIGENYDSYSFYQLTFHDTFPYDSERDIDPLQLVSNRYYNMRYPIFRLEVKRDGETLVNPHENLLYTLDPDFDPSRDLVDRWDPEQNRWSTDYTNSEWGWTMSFFSGRQKGGLELTFPDLKESFKGENALKPGDQIELTYYAYIQLDDGDYSNYGKYDSLMGAAGGVLNGMNNLASLEFSNNPNVKSSTGTLTDSAKIYTTQLLVIKEDGRGNPLTGAEFQLYKKYGNEYLPFGSVTDPDFFDKHGIYDMPSGQVIASYDFAGFWFGDGDYMPLSPSSWVFQGLSDGEYMIKETRAPGPYGDDYIMLDNPIFFRVRIDKNGRVYATVTDADEGALASDTELSSVDKYDLYIHYNYDGSDDSNVFDNYVYAREGDPLYLTLVGQGLVDVSDLLDEVEVPDSCWFKATTDFWEEWWEYGLLGFPPVPPHIYAFSLRIRNASAHPDLELPFTGAMGTRGFTLIGSVLMLAAGIVLVTNRRMKNREEE